MKSQSPKELFSLDIGEILRTRIRSKNLKGGIVDLFGLNSSA